MTRKININGQFMDVVDVEQYRQCPSAYNPKFTAIQQDGLVYPITNNTNSPGFYHRPGQLYGTYVEPTVDQYSMYNSDNIIDFGVATDMREIIEKSEMIKDMENVILTSSDNIYRPIITPNDTPEMRALKEAISAKNIDIDLYEHRFGASFNNDKRKLKDTKITLAKAKSISENLDMKIKIVIEDASDDIPNPMGKTIEVYVTGGDYGDE
ncbi:MAG: hypothetical protein ACRCXT_06175 [Paraclostridium sp.]